MILSIRVDNFLVFKNELEFSLIPHLHLKNFTDNIFNENQFKALK